MSKDEQAPAAEGAAAIIANYRALLDRLRLSPREIHDESELPDSKTRIAEALLAAYFGEAAHPYAPAELRGWLLTLAQFQPGVEAPIRDAAAEAARRVARARSRGERFETAALTQAIAEESRKQRWDARRARLMAKVEQERARLLERISAPRPH